MNISGFTFNNLRFRRFNIAAHDNLLYLGRYISLCAGSYVKKSALGSARGSKPQRVESSEFSERIVRSNHRAKPARPGPLQS